MNMVVVMEDIITIIYIAHNDDDCNMFSRETYFYNWLLLLYIITIIVIADYYDDVHFYSMWFH